jgi:predicted TIM-barrel fold metal-dependent hydrolase
VPGLRGGRSLGSKEFDPFWARINEAGIFTVLHVSDSGYDKINQWWTAGGKGEWRPFEKEPFGEILDGMGRAISDSLASLLCHGMFDRFPNVRVASLENGSAWLEPLMKRIADTHRKMPQEFKGNPIETFKRHVYVSPFYEDPMDKLVALIGSDRILFGSDWPHPEGLGRPLDYLNDVEGLAPADIKKIMHGNLKGLLEGAR